MRSFIRQIGYAAVVIAGMASAAVGPLSAGTAGDGERVFINQLGYLPGWPKYLISDGRADRFMIQDQSGAMVWRGGLRAMDDPTSKRRIWRGEFSGLNLPGRYQVSVPGVGRSYQFAIGADIYADLLRKGLRFYFLQRCGIALQDDETGLAHEACHVGDGFIARADAFHKAGDKIACAGGWHDAGDYGKYVSTTAVTVAQMLSIYELHPEKFPDSQLGIPESGNGRSDLLDEALVGLDWLLSMQRPDGAVYHKIGGDRWPTFTIPESDTGPRNVYGVSTFATAKFAAVAAMAARVLAPLMPDYAGRCARAARLAWDYLSAHPLFWDHDQFDDNGSGAYGQADDAADRLWASAELSLIGAAGGDLAASLERYTPVPVSWQDAALLGLFDLAKSPAVPDDLRQAAGAKIKDLAGRFLKSAQTSGYRYTLFYPEFVWASNKEALARGAVMLMADYLHPDQACARAALAQLDFVLGLNPLSKCFVTGLGSDPPRMTHHRFDAAQSRSVPGMLVGGPNNRAESGSEPAGGGPFSYIDVRASYSSNEPAIDYNAALIWLASWFAGPMPRE